MSEPVMSAPGLDPDEVEEAPPLVLVSSRDGVGDPGVDVVSNRSAAWRGLADKAGQLGWTASFTYALAWRAAKIASTGRITRAAHLVHTIALRLVRGTQRAFAVWSAESKVPGVIPASGWSFSVAGAGRTATTDKKMWTQAVMGVAP
jgi:hypothetical protein